jgi:peroxidase
MQKEKQKFKSDHGNRVAVAASNTSTQMKSCSLETLMTSVPRPLYRSASALLVFLIILMAPEFAQAENRTVDGTGNNVNNPFWGMVGQRFGRMDSTVHYGNGYSTPAGADRPGARDISNMVGAQSVSKRDARGLSDFVWQWGQFLDHDISLTPINYLDVFNIPVSDPGDPMFPVIPLMRSHIEPGTGTGLGNPREQFNQITSYIDASNVYGSDMVRASALRAFVGGRLKTTAGGGLLPRNTMLLPNANEGPEPDETLFLAGDIRANEQLGLTAMQTLFVREHNRLADDLVTQFPGWDDEQIYQHARKLVGGIVQAITYNEFLPALIGNAAPSIAGATYDSAVDATLLNEFATAAYRQGHTQISPQLSRQNPDGTVAAGGPVELKNAFFRPSHFTGPEEVDYLLKGLASNKQQASDLQMIDALRNTLFGPPGSGGLDLFAVDVQRGRDHGLPSYNEMRSALGLSQVTLFSQITSDAQTQADLGNVFSSVDQIDLWVGLLAEDLAAGASAGSTLQLMFNQQFTNLLQGDRFFFTWDAGLAPDDVDLIMDSTLASVIRRNTQITDLQANVFFVPEASGDFNGDGVYDCIDINELVAEIAAGTDQTPFDLTGDDVVDVDDRDAWLAEAGAANLASGNAYLVGDATLDGFVDGLDFLQWNNHKFSATAAWCSGDFDANGFVDGNDFILWNANKFTSADGLLAVPEPGGCLLFVLVAACGFGRRSVRFSWV